jgi:hypothetical protein
MIVEPYRILLIVVPEDVFVWKISSTNDLLQEVSLQADTRKMIQRNLTAGLARYTVKGPNSKSNVKVMQKKGTVNTWGIAVREGLVIKKNQEIFH